MHHLHVGNLSYITHLAETQKLWEDTTRRKLLQPWAPKDFRRRNLNLGSMENIVKPSVNTWLNFSPSKKFEAIL